jgi:O-antigen ligase
MVLGIVVFGAVFLVGLALGTATRRPVATASFVVAAFVAVLVVQTHEPLAGFAVFALIVLVGLVVDSVRETVELLLNR